MTNQELLVMLEKAGITTASGGLLNTEQSAKFIQTTIDQSEFLKKIRVEKNIATARDLDTMGVGTRLIHKPVEETAPDAALLKGINVGKRTLTPVEVMLPYDISLSYLEQNLEKQGVENTINTLFGKQFSNDLVDLMLNADTATSSGHEDYAFLSILNGIFKLANSDANKQLYSRASGESDWKGTVFPALINLLPEKYKIDPTNLVLLTSFQTEDEYRSQLADRATALGDAYTTEKSRAKFKGIAVEPVPTMPYGSILLTSYDNLAVGFGREITVYRQLQARARKLEYTITAKVDVNYVLTDKLVYCQ